MLITPPLGTNTSATNKAAEAKYKKIANASHQSISLSLFNFWHFDMSL